MKRPLSQHEIIGKPRKNCCLHLHLFTPSPPLANGQAAYPHSTHYAHTTTTIYTHKYLTDCPIYNLKSPNFSSNRPPVTWEKSMVPIPLGGR